MTLLRALGLIAFAAPVVFATSGSRAGETWTEEKVESASYESSDQWSAEMPDPGDYTDAAEDADAIEAWDPNVDTGGVLCPCAAEVAT